jgi:hypothetical protein
LRAHPCAVVVAQERTVPQLLAPSGRTVVRAPVSAADPSAPRYVRHLPERTLLYGLVQAYYPDFFKRLVREDRALPEYVRGEFEEIAGLMITTEAMVAEAPKKDEPMAGGHGGGGMGGMGGMDF